MRTEQQKGEDFFPQASVRLQNPVLAYLKSIDYKRFLSNWNWKHKTIVSFVITIVGLSLLLGCLMAVNAFFNQHYFLFQFPIQVKLVAPIEVKDRKPVVVEKKIYVTPTPTPKPFSLLPQAYAAGVDCDSQTYADPAECKLITSKQNGTWLLKIYRKESSAGKEDGCRKKGMYNGFGYHQDSEMWMCYSSLDEVASHVEAFFADNLAKGMTLSQATCFYNTGNPHLYSCNYYYEVETL